MSYPNRTASDYIALFSPSVQAPPEASPDILKGLGIVGLCIYTCRFDRHPLLSFARIGLVAIGCHFFLKYGWSSEYHHNHNRTAYLGLGTAGCYGILRLIEVCLTAELGPKPQWVTKPWMVGADGSIKAVPQKVIEPQTTWDQIMYTFDLLTTIRGVSWFGDRTWDFAPAFVVNWRPSTGTSRSRYIFHQLISLAVQYLVIDVVDFFNKSMPWDVENTNHPVTTLSLRFQALSCVSVALITILYLTIPYTVTSSMFVAFGSSPTAWPPMFNAPWAIHSLRDLWSYRWHFIFRRVYSQISAALLHFIPKSNQTLTRLLRWGIIFTLTTFLHLAIFYTLPPRALPFSQEPYPFFDFSTMKFFLYQPVGLFLETYLLFPITEQLPSGLKRWTPTVFAWGWLFFTVRFWCDAWVSKGMYDDTERPIVFSPIRGIILGDWII